MNMGFLAHACKWLVTVGVCFPLLAQAAEPLPSPTNGPPLSPLHYETRYDGRFLGIKVGRLRVRMQEADGHYDIALDTKLSGMARIFSSIRSFAVARGTVAADGQTVTPQFYESTEEVAGNPTGRVARLRFDEKGMLTERLRQPMDDPNWRPIVPIAQAQTGVDPISAYLSLRPEIQEALAKNAQEAVLRTYDGARLAAMRFRILGRTRVTIMDQEMPVIDTVLTRQPIAGYSPKELKLFQTGDPEIHIYFSDDARLLPVLATIGLSGGEFTITLEELK